MAGGRRPGPTWRRGGRARRPGPSLDGVLRRLRSPAAGVPVGILAGSILAPLLWHPVRQAAHTSDSAWLIAGGLGVALAATVATIWYGLATSGQDR